MTKQSKPSTQDDDLPSEQRSQTHFTKADRDKFNKEMEGLNAAIIYTAMSKFEREYRASKSNDEISGGFQIDQLHNEPGAFRLCEIRAGNDYRVAVMFRRDQPKAYWIHVWKKPKMNDRQSVNLAKLRAQEAWYDIRKREEEQRERERQQQRDRN